jgi:hypothetical protein
MPNRFPFLKSKTDPYGLIEQFGIAVTVAPESDSAETGPVSWFGRTLHNDAGTIFTYTGEDGTTKDTVAGHDNITKAYAEGKLLYTAYDWGITLLKIDIAAKTGEVEGAVKLKGHCDLFVNNPKEHKGRHFFRYAIVQVGKDWLIKEWSLRKEKGTKAGTDPLDEFINAPF